VPSAVQCHSRRVFATRIPLLALVLAALCLCGQASAQSGALTAPADLDLLTRSAATIIRGHVVSAVVEPHPQFSNLQTVVVTISVAKVFKGDAPNLFTFRQFIWDARDVATAGGYRKSSEFLLFLNPNSSYGLTSPVGLEQGLFRVTRDAKGNAAAVNGRGNAGLFNQLQSKASSYGATLSPKAQNMLAKSSGPAQLDALEETISTLVGAQR
jgi:hypothetical protein